MDEVWDRRLLRIPDVHDPELLERQRLEFDPLRIEALEKMEKGMEILGMDGYGLINNVRYRLGDLAVEVQYWKARALEAEGDDVTDG